MRAQKLGWAAVVITAAGIAGALFVFHSRQIRVAEANARLILARARLESARRVDELAPRIDAKVGQAVQSVIQPLVQKGEKEVILASVDAQSARTVAAADRCLASYTDYAEAQQAMATLALADVKNVMLRPEEPSDRNERRLVYRLMAPRGASSAALAALQEHPAVQIRSFSDPATALRAIEKLQKSGLRATARPLNSRAHSVYVPASDREAATEVLFKR